MRRSDVIAVSAALVVSGAALADAPGRVVTMNHCADQYALLLGAPGQVVSVSHIAVDPHLSAMVAEARQVVQNRGGAEEIYRLAPDLVLASTWSDPLAVGMLERLGIRVERVDGVERLADIPDRLREVGALLGREEVAEKAARAVGSRLAALPDFTGDRPEAAFFHAGGYSLGEGTLADDILTHAGFDNLARRVGRTDGGHIPVEVLLMNRPDLLITSGLYPGASQAEALMDHPAIAGIPRIESSAIWACGLPATLDAVEVLIEVRETLND